MTDSKGIITKEAQIYINEVHSARLLREGFSSLNGDGIAWYRVLNGEILQTIHYITRFTFRPIMLSMAYGCMPLYVEPMFPKGIYHYDLPDSLEVCTEVQLMQGASISAYSSDCSVMCPTEEPRGLDILEQEILLPLNHIDSESICFKAHYIRYEKANAWHTMSMQFIDEVIYQEEQGLYGVAIERVKTLMRDFDKYVFSKKKSEAIKQHLSMQHSALQGQDRDAFLRVLEKRRTKTLRTLMRHNVRI